MDCYNDEEIVISGIGGHYPKSDNLQELMENLFNGVDMTSDDNPKWSAGSLGVPHKIGCMKELTKCDAQFFGIIRKHCNSLDPVTRKILERTLEAIIDAGLSPQDFKESNTGVFISMALLETEMTLIQSNEQETYGIMGRNRALNANRISYWLDLKGPSSATDCLFNGGLQAIEQAYQAIKLGKIDAAFVGSGSTIIHPQSSYQYNKLKLLSPDGITRAFDAEANGYARAEAVSVMLLQRARDAKRSHGTIVHVLNQSMTTADTILQLPVMENWRDLHEKFYSDCKVDPTDVTYLEADGVANVYYDAAELNAVGETFCKGRTAENPLLIGSVKTNIGHAEGASNLCSVAKLIVAMESDKLPANLHHKTPNPYVRDLVQGRMKVVTETTPLKGDLVAMNSFGLGSTYGHLLLRRNLRRKNKVPKIEDGALPQLILVSSRNEEGMKKVLDTVEAVPFDREYAHLVNNAFRRGLSGHMYRGFTVVPPQEPNIHSFENYNGDKRPVWFIFAGMGSQWPTMARDLLHIPVFKRSIDVSTNVLKNHGLDLLYLLTHDDPTLFDNIIHSFVCIVAIQIALVDVLREIGIEPDGIIGHSVGETSASYADGCLTQEQTILSAYYRGRASVESKVIKGMMAAVGLGYQQMKDRLPEGIEIACHNGPDSCTLSGPSEQVESFVKQLSSEGVFARAVNVANIPYHSKYIQEMGPRMHDYLKHVIPGGKPRSSRWICTSFPESRWGESAAKICNANYHINNLLSPVLFEEGSRHIPPNAITIEIAPHGLLQAILKRSLPTCVNIALTNRNAKNQQHVFLKALGRMYQNGLEPQVHCLYPEVTYPVSRGTSFLSPLVTWDHTDNWSDFSSSIGEKNLRSRTFDLQLDVEGSIFRAHKEDGVAAVPLATYLMHVWEVFRGAVGKSQTDSLVELSDVLFHGDEYVSNKRDLRLSILIQPGSGRFEVICVGDDKEHLLVTGVIKEYEKLEENILAEKTFESLQEIQQEEFYSELLNVGHQYDQELQTIERVLVGKGEWRATVQWEGDLNKLLDALLQVRTLQASENSPTLQKIRKIRNIVLDPKNTEATPVEAQLEVNTDTIRCGGIEIRDVDFTGVPRNPLKFAKDELNTPVVVVPPAPDSLNVAYLQFIGSEAGGKQLAYIGTEGGQQKLMGLAVADDTCTNFKEDAILKWQIPSKWTLEEAASIPLNYCMAYHALHIVGQLSPGQSLAVTDGTNKLGLACLRIALNVTTSVITVVNTDAEKKQLQMLLPKLKSENILINGRKASDQLCLKLKMRCPKGLNIVINTGAPDIVHMIIQCMSPFGIAIEMSDELFESRGKLKNTYDFLISASLYSCSGNDVSDSTDDNKKQIQQLMVEGMSSGVVVPFNDSYSKDWRQTKTIKVDSGNTTSVNSRFQCDPEKTYLILGGDPYSWLATAEWFVQRKAKNIIVVHKETKLNNSLHKKLKYLQEKSNLIVKPTNKLSPDLIDHIFSVSKAKIALTMLMPLAPEEDPDENVVEALGRKDTFLVTVLRSVSGAVHYCKERNSRSNSTLTILWNEPLNGKTRGFLQTFDRLLTSNKNQVVKINEEEDETSTKADKYENLLPKSLEEVLSDCEYLPTDVKLTELQTKSVGFKKTKEVQAIFVIPGLTNRKTLIQSLRGCLYPVFIIDFPSLSLASVSEYAACIVPKLKALSKGPYALLGEGWGGAVALDAAHMLERTGEEAQVFLLAASPLELNKWGSTEELDIALLTRLFETNPEVLQKETSWSGRINICLAAQPLDLYKTAIRSLNFIRSKAVSLLNIEVTKPLRGTVTCVSKQNISRSEVANLSQQDIVLAIVDADEELLNDAVLHTIQRTIALKTIPK